MTNSNHSVQRHPAAISKAIKRNSFCNNRTSKGFTLIEIMVALFIVSFTVVAVIDTMSKHANVTSELEKRVMASWIASNVIAEMRFDARINRLKQGGSSETIDMGGLSWRARSKVEETDVERVFLVTVEVQNNAERDAPPFAVLTTALTDRL